MAMQVGWVSKRVSTVKILIIDNHAELVKQIEIRLSSEPDFEVCMVASLDRLTESLIDCNPDLLLIDPYFDSSYKYDRIRMARKLRPDLVVVVLTAVVDTALSVRLKKEGVHCVLEKGVSSTVLVDSLRKVIAAECTPKAST
jgi:DNA-binding NarL/FixJ family response regulator